MIHILTIHWNSEKWIDIQLKYLNHYIDQPFKVYAYLNGIENVKNHVSKYHYVSTEHIKSHATKLNLLADMVAKSEKQDDIIIFIDGDAFPIAPIIPFILVALTNYQLAAIQRQENYGDIQPHPSFCITTVAYWKKIQGDWNSGDITWKDTLGNDVKDVGGIMLKKLIQHNEPWYKLLRSNKIDQNHPVLFGKYDNLIYHHGAGFRSPVMRSDSNKIKFLALKKMIFSIFSKILPKRLVIDWFGPYRKLKIENNQLSDDMYQKIQDDFYFFNQL